MIRALLIIAAAGTALTAAVAYAVLSRRSPDDGLEEIVVTAKRVTVNTLIGKPAWYAPTKYAPAINAAEITYGMPTGLLMRQLYEESRYREDIINGLVLSPVGAVGIAQIVPQYHPDVDPYDPNASIWYAGQYLAHLFSQFGGDWKKALAAYNWGPGHMSRIAPIVLWESQLPTETRNYVDRITQDVPV